MRFRLRLCNVLLWGILYGYTETARVALKQPALFVYSHRVFIIKAHYKAADGIAYCPRFYV